MNAWYFRLAMRAGVVQKRSGVTVVLVERDGGCRELFKKAALTLR
jgi:hypothetical protein